MRISSEKCFFFFFSFFKLQAQGKLRLVSHFWWLAFISFLFLLFVFWFPYSVLTPTRLTLAFPSHACIIFQHTNSSLFLPFVSLLSEHTTFPLCDLPLSTFFPWNYSAESFPLETVRGRLVLYQCVCMCVFGGGGLGERISKAFLITVRWQPGIPSLSRGVWGGRGEEGRCFICI